MTGGIFDWAGVAAFLAVLGGGLKYLLDQRGNSAGRREADLTQREREYREKIEGQVARLEKRLNRMEQAYGFVIGIVHVWVEEIDHDHPSLPMIVAQLRLAYPTPTDMPADLINLVTRLEAQQRGGKRKAQQ